MANFIETEGQLIYTQIQELEKFVSISFPSEYITHLLKFNGGRCSPNKFKFFENGRWTESCIDWFLAIYDGKYDNLRSYILSYKIDEKRLPTHILPIANDPGGNLICISCGKNDEGQIYFWDHENEVDYTLSDDDDYSNLYFISKSLNEFLESLEYLNENED